MTFISSLKNKRRIGFIFIGLSMFITTLNDTILNISLPMIARELGASTSELQWVQNAYLLIFASSLLTMGTLSDRFGRKRFLLLGVSSFAAFSLLAGITQNIQALIVIRGFQGLSGAIIIPSTLSLISAIFPESAANRKAISIWSAMFGLGAAFGPILGGWLLGLDVISWKIIFFVNIPFALIAFLGAAVFLGESKDLNAPQPDIPGVILSILALFALVFAIIRAGEAGWGQPQTLIGFAAALSLLAGFLVWEKHTSHPMLPLQFYKNMSFSAASLSMALTLFSIMGVFFFMPQFFQGIQNYSPLETGVLLIPQALISVAASLFSHRMVRWIGIKRTLSGGFLLGAVGIIFLGLTLQADTPYLMILLGFLLMFIGIDSAMPAATMSIMGSVPEEKAGVGSATNEMTAQIGAALGIAVMGAVVNRTYLQHLTDMNLDFSPSILNEIQSSIFSARAALYDSGLANGQILSELNNGFINGMKISMLLGGVLLIITALIDHWKLPNQVVRSSGSPQKD